eukprot:297359_1
MSQNAKKVLSFKDVVRDVYHNIAPAYQTYVLQTDDGTTKEYKTKTYMVGNLDDPSVHNKFMPNLTALRKKYGNGRKQVQFNKKNKYMLHTDDFEDSHFDVTTDYCDETEDTHAHDGSDDSQRDHNQNNILYEDNEDEEEEKVYSNNKKVELTMVNKKEYKNEKKKSMDNNDDDADDD